MTMLFVQRHAAQVGSRGHQQRSSSSSFSFGKACTLRACALARSSCGESLVKRAGAAELHQSRLRPSALLRSPADRRRACSPANPKDRPIQPGASMLFSTTCMDRARNCTAVLLSRGSADTSVLAATGRAGCAGGKPAGEQKRGQQRLHRLSPCAGRRHIVDGMHVYVALLALHLHILRDGHQQALPIQLVSLFKA